MKRNQKIAFLSLGIALYVVLSAFVIIPIVNRIKLDLGYIVFAMYLNTFGMPATIVGVAGCILAELLKGGKLIKTDKWFPSSQLCSKCGSIKKIPLSQRTYICECGNIIDRDFNSAINIALEGRRIVSA